MLTKLVRTALTIAGGIVGYGVFLLSRFFITLSGHGDIVEFSTGEEICIAAFFCNYFWINIFQAYTGS